MTYLRFEFLHFVGAIALNAAGIFVITGPDARCMQLTNVGKRHPYPWKNALLDTKWNILHD